MLRPFANSTLIDICLEKVSRLDWHAIYFGVYEDIFIEKAKKYKNLKIYKRSYDSVHEDIDAKKVFEILNYIPTTWVLWINPCHPFLRVETIEKAIDYFLTTPYVSMTSVKKASNWFYGIDGKPINNIDVIIDTKRSDFIYEVAHAFHIYRRDIMLRHGKPWFNNKNNPHLFEIPNIEALDIDTEEEFIMVECLYDKLMKKEQEV
ncbi:MAG: hypothetical protein KAS99_00480 [Candidatus Omnitrophica bacterium]|nr:hypothetical protein [Candidatus Omnitrophota bacterium]